MADRRTEKEGEIRGMKKRDDGEEEDLQVLN